MCTPCGCVCVPGVAQNFFLSVIEGVESASDMFYFNLEGGGKEYPGRGIERKCG